MLKTHVNHLEFNPHVFHDFVWKNGNVPIALQQREYSGMPPTEPER